MIYSMNTIEKQGYHAYFSGSTAFDNPYTEMPDVKHWDNGWMRAYSLDDGKKLENNPNKCGNNYVFEEDSSACPYKRNA